MTSTLGINDTQPRNLEAPRSAELIPDQIRSGANNFLILLEEYYKFMNVAELTTATTARPTTTVLSGKNSSGPSNIIHSILAELDIDQVNLDYLTHIQTAVAPHIPIPTYMSSDRTDFYKRLNDIQLATYRASLYQKIVKHFYNTRGSRNSVYSFFRLLYNDTVNVFDISEFPIITDELMYSFISEWLLTSGCTKESIDASVEISLSDVKYTRTPKQAWLPFTYVIQTAIPESDFERAYRTLVHPVGFKYIVDPIGGAAATDKNIIVADTGISDSRMICARRDYQKSLWFLDQTPLQEFGGTTSGYTIIDAVSNYNQAFQNTIDYTYADWSNIGAIIKLFYILNPGNALGLYGNQLPTSATTLSTETMIAGITSISQVNVAGTTIISTTPPTYKTGQNDFNTTPLYGGKSIWFNGKRSFEAGQYRLTYLGGVYTLYTFNVPINGLLWRWGNTVFPIADVQNISTTSDGAITVSAIPPGPYYFTSTSQSGFETANIGTTFEFYHPGGALGFCIGDTGVNFSDNVIGAIGGSSSYAGPHFRLDAVPSSGKAIIKIPNLLTQFNNSDHLQVGAVVTGANLATISPTSTVTVSSIDVSNDIVTLVQTNNVGLTNIISGSSLTQSNLSITFRMNSLSYDYLTSPGNISVVTTGSAIKNITSSSAIADSTKVSKALYTASSSQIYSTASSGTTSLDFYTLSSNVIPGLFVSCSGAITTTSNTYIKNIKKSNKSYESIVGWAYGGSNSFFYTDSSVVGSSNVIVGSAFDSDKQLFASDGIVSSISSLSLPQPTVICTWITTSALLPGNTEMAIKVSNSQINTTSTAGINVFNNLFNLWNNGAVPIYVSTGGDGINNNYKQSDGYHISVSSMVSTTSTIVLKKSNGATWTSALPSGNIGSTNNSVIIFTTVEPGTTVQDWYPYDDRVSYFGGGKSYSAGWYKVTYQGGAFNERSTFRANTGIRCNGASRDGNQPPLIIDYNNNIVTIESFHPGDGEKNIFYEFSYFQNNKYAYFWHPGGTIGICISDYLGWGDNGWGFPLPIITLSRPPFIELSSIADNTGYGKINFSNPVLTMLISSATTASISTGSTVNFYGHVIDLDKSNTGFTALTDTLEIE